MSQELATGSITASGVLVSGPCSLDSVGILAGADAATAVYREGSSLGPIIWALGVAAGVSASHTFSSHVRVLNSLYVVVTGTTPKVLCAIESPAAAQVTPA